MNRCELSNWCLHLTEKYSFDLDVAVIFFWQVWSEGHVPLGATHLRSPFAEAVAATLGVHFARALVGFEQRNGPRFLVTCTILLF